jgi:hypothetical protein
LTAAQQRARDTVSRELCKDFALPPAPAAPPSERETFVRLSELARFLRCPAEAALRRHLRLRDEDEAEGGDEEPFHLGSPLDFRLLGRVQEQFVRLAVRDGVEAALAAWKEDFGTLYEQWQRCCRVPDGAFGDAIRERFLNDLDSRIKNLSPLLEQLREHKFIAPVQIGPPLSPVGAGFLLPRLRLETLRGLVSVVGSQDLAWLGKDEIVLLTIHTGSKANVRAGALCRPLLRPLLFGVALRAGETLSPDYQQFADRTLQVHLAHEGGIASYSWPPEALDGNATRDYLLGLVNEFLEETRFDLLPADILFGERNDFRSAYDGRGETATTGQRRAYARKLQDAVDRDRDSFMPLYRLPKLLRIVPAKVPGNAFDQVQRRFGFLDRALALARRAER